MSDPYHFISEFCQLYPCPVSKPKPSESRTYSPGNFAAWYNQRNALQENHHPYHNNRNTGNYLTSKQPTETKERKEIPKGLRPIRPLPKRTTKETTDHETSQRRTYSINDQRLHRSKQPVEAKAKTIQDQYTSHLLQKVTQKLSTLLAMDAPQALSHNNQPAKTQRTHATQSQSGQMGKLFTQIPQRTQGSASQTP